MRQEVLVWLEQERRGQNTGPVEPSKSARQQKIAPRKAPLTKRPVSVATMSSTAVSKPRRKHDASRRRSYLNPIAAAVALGASVSAIFFPLIAIYVLGQEIAFSRPLSQVLPLPAAYLDGPPIMLREYLSGTAALSGYYRRRNPSLSTRQIHQYVFARLVERRALDRIAQRHALQLPPSDVDRQLNGLITEAGSRQQFIETLGREFPSWGIPEFESYLLRPYLLRQLIHLRLSTEPASWAKAEQTARQIREQLTAGELNFDEAARRYSQDTTATLGGDLGYITLSNLTPEVAAVVSTLPRGQISAPIRNSTGYHLVLVRVTLGQTENSPATRYRIQQISISTAPDLRTMVNQAVQELNVRRLVAWPSP